MIMGSGHFWVSTSKKTVKFIVSEHGFYSFYPENYKGYLDWIGWVFTGCGQ